MCGEKDPTEAQSAGPTAAESEIPPVHTFIVHERFSEWGCLLGGSNPREGNELSNQELISS